MSNVKKMNAKLKGLEGPFFPPCIEELQKAFYGQLDKNFTGSILDGYGKCIPGFTYIANERTSDGYVWFWAMNFWVLSGGRISILFPWGMDSTRADGTSAERHIAMYKDARCSDSDVESTVRKILDAHAK